MKIFFFSIILIFNFSSPSFLQVLNTEKVILSKLDSIRNASSLSRYFASAYYETTRDAVEFYSGTQQKIHSLMDKFEQRFADLFFKAASAQKEGEQIPPEWNYYYLDSAYTPLQYLLIGINTHINEDIWQALIAQFSLFEIEEIKANYFAFYKSLKNEYNRIYSQAWLTNQRIRQLHFITFGLDKEYGKMMLKKWRRRQFKIAALYYKNPVRFDQKLMILKRKTANLNHMITHLL